MPLPTDVPSALLLLDLDGVTVLEHGPPWLEKLEILQLHATLLEFLRDLGAPVVVLTHRSRAEARRILQAARLGEAGLLADVFAAEDLALAAWRHRAFRALFGRGLRKSLCLPEVEARHGVRRSDMALIDDRMDNLEDMLAHGLGLAMHAPSAVEADGAIVSFDAAEAASTFAAWRADRTGPKLVPLAPRRLTLDQCGRTGLCTTREGAHAFNRLRTAARHVRRSLDAIRP